MFHLLIFFCWSLTMDAQAQTIPEGTVLSSPSPKTIYFDGPVDKKNVDYTMKRLSKGDTLVINSLGGDAREAHRFAEFIQQNGINTHINSTGQVQSAAALMYAAGKKRTAGKNAQFHFHMARNPDGTENVDATTWYFTELGKRGVNIDQLRKFPILQDTITIDPLLGKSIGLITD